MTDLTLAEADAIAQGAIDGALHRGLNPIAVCVLDRGGHALVVKRQEGATFLRVDIATAKAWTAISLAAPSRNFAVMAETRPQFVTSLVTISQGRMAPAAGGVLVLREGQIIGSVGVSGDTPDNDEVAALDGVRAAGLASSE
ncbi:MAG TPA: heme-binding protein [Acidimicrobiales bacterium]|nr:heme-binding protein [Acidimicrobiales bacterium]